MREFRISSVNMEKTLAKAQKIAERGKRKGLSGGFACRIESREEIVNGIVYEYPVLIIEGETVKYNGYKFLAVAEVIEGQVLTRSIAGSTEIKPSDVKVGYCEHCQTNRARKSVLFVQHEESGAIKQVGSTCIKDFLGWEFSATALVTEQDFEEEFGGNFGVGFSGIGTLSVATLAIKVVKDIGYIKEITKDTVLNYFFGSYSRKAELEKIYGTEFSEAEKAEGQALIEFAQKFEGDSSYAQNLRAVAQLRYQRYDTIGIFISAIKAQQRLIEQEIAKETAKVYKSEQIAPVGERVELPVKVLSSNTFETQFGSTTLWTFESGDYKVKWFDSGYSFRAEIGDEFIIKGTVKGSDEYKGTFSTLLSRVKKVEVKELVSK